MFARDLRLLHDIVALTSFADRYWMWGGLLLGWARERKPLAHDLLDADFAFRTEDVAHFEDAAHALIRGGFQPLARFRNNLGEVTEYSFLRNGAKFEFFALSAAAADKLRYYLYDDGSHGTGPATEAEAELTAQPLESFRFLRRRWKKHVDHRAELSELYGDWQTPDPSWWYMNELTVVDRQPWHAQTYMWSGELPGDRRS